MTDDPIENHLWLLLRFLERLWAERPRTVLDVGCGAGRLLAAARDRDIAATGLDEPGPGLEALRASGCAVEAGSAEALPFPDEAFDWVTLRHVPHHLTDPGAAMAEALRVASRGVLVAEPWFDTAVASQRAALEFDRFEKRQHRRQGRVHGESLSFAELLELVGEAARAGLDVEAHHWLRLRERDVGGARRDARALLDALPPDDAEEAAFAELRERLDADGLSWNGSVACVLRKREDPANA